MKRLLSALSLAVAFALATGSVARAEEKVLGALAKLELSKDRSSAVATLTDSKSGQTVEVVVEDKLTLDKFKDNRINVGDEIKARYEKRGARNLATYFRKAGGC